MLHDTHDAFWVDNGGSYNSAVIDFYFAALKTQIKKKRKEKKTENRKRKRKT